MRCAAIIVAAGQGQRAGGGLPKQLRLLGGRPVFLHAVDTFLGHEAVAETILVVPVGEASTYRPHLPEHVQIVEGGATRTASVQAGLSACTLSQQDIVLIHDAARPGLHPRTISDLIAALNTSDAAAPALPVSDALKRQRGEQVETVNRANLFRIQTPQAFRFGQIRKALEQKSDLVDDLAAIEAAGGRVKLVPGDERLSKITYAEDFARMETLLFPPQVPRFGTGFDVHAFEEGDHVTLCGVRIPHSQKLAGHSDADVAWHALTDAILGAAALGDIGDHFPPSDPKWKGTDSALFLRHAVDLIEAEGFHLTSCDITLICEAPKVKPHREAMRQRTAEVTRLPIGAVSVKATTTEGLGFTGRREGIAAQASAVLSATRKAP